MIKILKESSVSLMEFEVPGFQGLDMYTDDGDCSVIVYSIFNDANSVDEDFTDYIVGEFYNLMSVDEDYKTIVGKEYVAHFNNEISRILGTNINAVYTEMISPKYYNYSTDRLFAKVSLSQTDEEKIYNYVYDHINSFRKYIKDNFTSYDGFISFYDNNADNWMAKDFDNFDHIELGSIFGFILFDNGVDLHDLNYSVYENLDSNNKGFVNYICDRDYDTVLKRFNDTFGMNIQSFSELENM